MSIQKRTSKSLKHISVVKFISRDSSPKDMVTVKARSPPYYQVKFECKQLKKGIDLINNHQICVVVPVTNHVAKLLFTARVIHFQK